MGVSGADVYGGAADIGIGLVEIGLVEIGTGVGIQVGFDLGVVAVAAQTFPRSARLTRPSEFKRVFRHPVVSSDRGFRVLACRGTGPVSRLGLAVSRRAERTAVGRNRIKRIVRESFRHRFACDGDRHGDGRVDGRVDGQPEPPMDIVVLAHPGCATISNAQLFRSLDLHWARIVAKLTER